jgi:hypothetical protein
MPGALGPRFALEAGFLILLAAVLGFADLGPALIILIMALAWVLVSLIEYFAWRQGPRFAARWTPAAEPSGALAVEEVEERKPPPPPPSRPPAPPPEEETVIEPAAQAEGAPEAGSPEESVSQAGDRVAARRLAFDEEERRTRYRLEPLQPRPRRRFGLFGLLGRRESGKDQGPTPDESSSEEER